MVAQVPVLAERFPIVTDVASNDDWQSIFYSMSEANNLTINPVTTFTIDDLGKGK